MCHITIQNYTSWNVENVQTASISCNLSMCGVLDPSVLDLGIWHRCKGVYIYLSLHCPLQEYNAYDWWFQLKTKYLGMCSGASISLILRDFFIVFFLKITFTYKIYKKWIFRRQRTWMGVAMNIWIFPVCKHIYIANILGISKQTGNIYIFHPNQYFLIGTTSGYFLHSELKNDP